MLLEVFCQSDHHILTDEIIILDEKLPVFSNRFELLGDFFISFASAISRQSLMAHRPGSFTLSETRIKFGALLLLAAGCILGPSAVHAQNTGEDTEPTDKNAQMISITGVSASRSKLSEHVDPNTITIIIAEG